MSKWARSVDVTRTEVHEFTYCNGCGKEAPPLEPGQYVAAGWYRIEHQIDVWDACSSVCAIGFLSGITEVVLSRQSSEHIFKYAKRLATQALKLEADDERSRHGH